MWRILIYYDDDYGHETNLTHKFYSSKAKANSEYEKMKNIKSYRFKTSLPGMCSYAKEIKVKRVVLEQID